MCIDIVEIWFWIANGQILTQLSARDMPIFSIPDDNLSKYQWIFAKLGMCIDMWRSSLGLLIGKFCQFLTELSARDMPVFLFLDNNLSKCWWILTKLAGYYACGTFIAPWVKNWAEDIFKYFLFPRKEVLTFYANCLHWRQLACNVKTCLLG